MPEHKDIPESGLHEPKGVSTAAANRVYVANGSGSGSWSQVDANTLSGTMSNSAEADLVVVTDGSGGFTTKEDTSSFGMLTLTGNSTAISVTAAATSNLSSNSDYTQVSLTMASPTLLSMAAGSNYLEISQTGYYLISFWANVFNNTTSNTVAVKFAVNGTDFVERRPKAELPNSSDMGNISGSGIHEFTAGDKIYLYIASEKTANITIEDMALSLTYLESSE